MTEREYAVSLGLAQMTRGRMSREAHAAIADAKANGMAFSDTVVARKVTGSVNANPLPAEPVGDRSPFDTDPLTPTPGMRRAKQYLLFKNEAGDSIKVFSTEGCINCHDSFTYCHCNRPTFSDWRTRKVYTLAS